MTWPALFTTPPVNFGRLVGIRWLIPRSSLLLAALNALIDAETLLSVRHPVLIQLWLRSTVRTVLVSVLHPLICETPPDTRWSSRLAF